MYMPKNAIAGKEQQYFQELIAWVKSQKPDKGAIAKKKYQLARTIGIKKVPKDILVYLHAIGDDVEAIRPYLQSKPTRTISGVAVVATMTRPSMCPHGSCTFCPGGLNSYFGNTPKSYTGKEPSTMRGIRNDFDPYRIIFNRLEHYIAIGQSPDKVEQIVMGGTFPGFPKKYQEQYAYYSFKAYNDFSQLFFHDGEFDIAAFKEFFELPADVGDKRREENVTRKILALKEQEVKSMEEEQIANEAAAIRCIGLTIETKPDWGFLSHGLELLRLGATRIELGIQNVYDESLAVTHRGHTLADTKKSIAELRDLGFKLNFHVMPGLPGVDGRRISHEMDVASLRTIFDSPDFRPDMLKVYPCMVMPGTELEKSYKAGVFTPLSTAEAAELIVELYRMVPEYCRIMRVQRDIPTYATVSGVDRTNLRQYVDELAREKGVISRDIRAREIMAGEILGEPALVVRDYEASGGREFFISMEADDTLLGFVRLRLPPRSLHPAITPSSALIRELHVYGQAVMIGKKEHGRAQHKGFGKRLMAKAESIGKAHGRDKMVVISGIGAREYFRRLGYGREGPYMVKAL